MNAETAIMQSIRLAAGSRSDVRLFRNFVGGAWVGKVIARTKFSVTLQEPRSVEAGLCTGSPDLVGWRIVTVTPDMVGKRLAVFAGLEVKTNTGRPTHDQLNFLAAVKLCGGLAGVVRTPEQAIEVLDAI